MSEPFQVVFVCTGNTCRSPMAEAMFRDAAEGEVVAEVRSAGVAAGPGGAASRETVEVLRQRGLELDGFRSRMVDEQLLAGATHVFCMTRSHLETLEMIYPEYRDQFFLVCDFVERDGVVGRDVPDPIGQGRGAYQDVAACFDGAMVGILSFLKSERDGILKSEGEGAEA